MGFFNRFFGGVSKVANKVVGGVRKIGNGLETVLTKGSNLAHGVRNVIDRAYQISQRIPVVSDIVRAGINKPIPQLQGRSLAQIASMGEQGIAMLDNLKNTVGSANRGDIGGVVSGVSEIANRG